MTMVETPIPVGDIEIHDEEEHHDDEQMCHLYNSGGMFSSPCTHTVCGIPREDDPHHNVHRGKDGPLVFTGQHACPACGMPLCMDCMLKSS